MTPETEQKQTKRPAKRKYAKPNITTRAIKVLAKRSMGAKISKIAKELGICEDTVYRDLQAVKQHGLDAEFERERYKQLWDMILANAIGNIQAGNWQTAKDVLDLTGVHIDKLELTGKIEPGDQQKKFMERVETLLKLTPVQEPTDPLTKALEQVKPEEMKPGAMVHVDKEGNRVKETNALQEGQGSQGQAENETKTKAQGKEGGDTHPLPPTETIR